MSMFGLIVSGRLVQTDFKMVEPGKFAIEIAQARDIHHIVVFLTGVESFPIGYGAQIYFNCPNINSDPSQPPVWHLLGHLSNEKPSAIFKISNLKNIPPPDQLSIGFGSVPQSLFAQQQPIGFGPGAGGLINNNNLPPPSSPVNNAMVGISIESLEVIQQSTPAALTNPSQVSTFTEYTQKMLQNFVNYATSFGDSDNISIQVINNWFENFKRRLQADPYFWR